MYTEKYGETGVLEKTTISLGQGEGSGIRGAGQRGGGSSHTRMSCHDTSASRILTRKVEMWAPEFLSFLSVPEKGKRHNEDGH